MRRVGVVGQALLTTTVFDTLPTCTKLASVATNCSFASCSNSRNGHGLTCTRLITGIRGTALLFGLSRKHHSCRARRFGTAHNRNTI